jgi:tellurite resistance protein
MNTLTDRQQETLARGLSAFDSASRRRRNRRRVYRYGSVTAVVAVCAVLAHRASQPTPAGLPGYVELVRDDAQLSAELELANACERFSRTDGRLVVVECVVP